MCLAKSTLFQYWLSAPMQMFVLTWLTLPDYTVEGMACHSMQLHLPETLNGYSIQFLIKI